MPRFLYLCTRKKIDLMIELIIVWVLAVVAFFVLWALLLKVIKRISDKKEQQKATLQQVQEPEKDEILKS